MNNEQVDPLDKYPDLKYHVEMYANYPMKDENLDAFALSCFELGRTSQAKEQEKINNEPVPLSEWQKLIARAEAAEDELKKLRAALGERTLDLAALKAKHARLPTIEQVYGPEILDLMTDLAELGVEIGADVLFHMLPRRREKARKWVDSNQPGSTARGVKPNFLP